MDPTKVLALVLAGGNGTRLHPLTAEHAKPALPFAADYRIVDFVLSNLVNSGITSIYVLAQYKPQSLIEHIRAVWAPALRGPGRFVSVVLPGAESARAPFLGTADAVHKNLHLCARHAPDLVAVFAADHVYRMDVGQMVEAHVLSKADISVAAVPAPSSGRPPSASSPHRPTGASASSRKNPIVRRRSRRGRATPTHRWATTCSIRACSRRCSNRPRAVAKRISAGTSCRARRRRTASSRTTSPATGCRESCRTRSPITGATWEPLRRIGPLNGTHRVPGRSSAWRTSAGPSAAVCAAQWSSALRPLIES